MQAGKTPDVLSGYNPDYFSELKYCPITSLDVEQSCSIYKYVFNNRRHTFIKQNLKKIVVPHSLYPKTQ